MGDFLQISSGFEVILGYFGFTKFSVLDFSRIVFTKFGVLEFYGFVRNIFSCVWARIELAVLVDLVLDLAQSCLS